MAQYLKQSTAATIMFGPFVDKTDGVTLKTDATTITDIDHATTGIFLSKVGGTAAVRHQGVTASVADAYGMMKVTLDTTDTNTLGSLDVLFAKAATYLPVWKTYMVVPANIWDSWFGASLQLVDISTIKTQAVTCAAGVTVLANVGFAGAPGANNGALTTDGTSMNQLLKQGTHTSVVIPTVTTVTNQLTAAAVATGVWKDATAGDFTDASSIGKALYIANVAPGASGGHMISGSNAGTTTLAALTVTGATTLTGTVVCSDAVTVAKGVAITNSTATGPGLSITGNTTGAGILATGGNAAPGISAVGIGTGGHGILATSGTTAGTAGIKAAGGATGATVGMLVTGGTTSGVGLSVTTTSGDAISVAPTAGNAITLAANGTSKHGISVTGGTAGTSDAVTLIAGSGGTDLRAPAITGTLSTLTTYTGNTLQTGNVATLITTVGAAGAGLTAIPTIGAVTTVGTVTNAVTLPAIPNNWITAAGIADAAIDNATFAADVGTTAFATNNVALATFKALDSAITDAVSLTTGGLLEKVRRMSWVMTNKIAVTDASGDTVIYKDDNSTPAYSVNAMLTDDLTTTTRLRAA